MPADALESESGGVLLDKEFCDPCPSEHSPCQMSRETVWMGTNYY